MVHKGLSTQATMAPLCPRAGVLAQPAPLPLATQELNGVCRHWRELLGRKMPAEWADLWLPRGQVAPHPETS